MGHAAADCVALTGIFQTWQAGGMVPLVSHLSIMWGQARVRLSLEGGFWLILNGVGHPLAMGASPPAGPPPALLP